MREMRTYILQLFDACNLKFQLGGRRWWCNRRRWDEKHLSQYFCANFFMAIHCGFCTQLWQINPLLLLIRQQTDQTIMSSLILGHIIIIIANATLKPTNLVINNHLSFNLDICFTHRNIIIIISFLNSTNNTIFYLHKSCTTA